MKAKSNKTVEELICDDSFCKFASDPDEQTLEYWNAYRRENPEKLKDIEEARQLILLLGNNKVQMEPDERVSAIWYQLQNSLEAKNGFSKKPVPSKGIAHWNIALKVAASVVILVGVFFAVSKNTFTSDVAGNDYTNNYFQKSTPMGQKSTVYLPDGSRVTMNAGSTIEYFEEPTSNNRELVLHGEAFFDVKRDTLKPFIVKTKNLNTTVLGTSFNVRAYDDEPRIEVALVSGKVSLSDDLGSANATLILSPGNMASYNKTNKAMNRQRFESERILAWTDKTLFFEDVNFNELTTTLERWYGVEFILENKLERKNGFMGRRDYKGKYKNKSLKTVLEAISFSYGFEFEINGKTVLIK